MGCISLREEGTPDREELTVGNYRTRHFDMCPGATSVYKNIKDKTTDMDPS
jgi:hypothetical protein